MGQDRSNRSSRLLRVRFTVAVVTTALIAVRRSRHFHQLADAALAGLKVGQQAPPFCPSS